MKTVAAVDLGSNSFHMIIARSDGGPPQVLDRLRERVRIAGGLDEEGRIDEATQQRAFDCLARFGHRLREFSSDQVRAVGTNTFRSARNARSFRRRAEAALGHRIEIISGGEEARLIHLGVHSQLPQLDARHLIVDIGGGSTELIVADGSKILLAESLPLGCVTHTRRHFRKGRLTEKIFRQAILAARVELRPYTARFRELGWTVALGSAGTAHAIERLIHSTGDPGEPITRAGLRRLRDHLIEAETIDCLELPELNEDRRPVIAGGIAVLSAIFKACKVGELTATPGGLREGILTDLVGRDGSGDVREATIAQFQGRFEVDLAQAERVERTALRLFEVAREAWGLDTGAGALLRLAARLHEVGLSISHRGHQRHGEYLIRCSELPGFSTDEQEAIAFLVRFHRRKVRTREMELPEMLTEAEAHRLLLLLRLAVSFHRARVEDARLPFAPRVEGEALQLCFPPGWFSRHPLTEEELRRELELASSLGVEVSVELGAADA